MPYSKTVGHRKKPLSEQGDCSNRYGMSPVPRKVKSSLFHATAVGLGFVLVPTVYYTLLFEETFGPFPLILMGFTGLVSPQKFCAIQMASIEAPKRLFAEWYQCEFRPQYTRILSAPANVCRT